MTEDQIKAIAEEYANMHMDRVIPLIGHKDNIRNTFIQEAERVLSELSNRYCIVEREKVMNEYQDVKSTYEKFKGDEDYFEGYWEGRLDSYEDIFGTSMFNQKEE